MPMVYLIDERIKTPRSLLAEVPEKDFAFLVNPYSRVAEIVGDVVERFASLKSLKETSRARGGEDLPIAPLITELRILAYGDARELQLGRGVDVANAGHFAPLASHMGSSGNGLCWLLGYDISGGTFRRERFLGGVATAQRIGSPFDQWGYDEIQLHDGAGYPLLH